MTTKQRKALLRKVREALLCTEARAWREIARWFLEEPGELRSCRGLCYAVDSLPVLHYGHYVFPHMRRRIAMHLAARTDALEEEEEWEGWAFRVDAEHRPIRAMCAMFLALECEDEAKAP